MQNHSVGVKLVLDILVKEPVYSARFARRASPHRSATVILADPARARWRARRLGAEPLLYENKAFAIQEIDVQTDGVIPVGPTTTLGGSQIGRTNLPSIWPA